MDPPEWIWDVAGPNWCDMGSEIEGFTYDLLTEFFVEARGLTTLVFRLAFGALRRAEGGVRRAALLRDPLGASTCQYLLWMDPPPG